MADADVNVPIDLRNFIDQHYGYLTQACQLFEQLDLPMTREDDDGNPVDAADSMDAYRLTTAMHVHPAVIGWWGAHALGCLSVARELATRRGKEGLEPVIRVIGRDIESFRRVEELFAAMPDDVQDLVRRTSAHDAKTVLALFGVRHVFSLPGTVLYAWQAEWHEAVVAFHEVFGGTPPPRAPALAGLAERLAETEEGIRSIRRQLSLASAVFHQDEERA